MSGKVLPKESENIREQQSANNEPLVDLTQEEEQLATTLSNDILMGRLDDIQNGKVSEAVLLQAIKEVSTNVSISSGPLPTPDVLKEYDNALPGADERIMIMAEKEQAHRHNFDNKCRETDSRDGLLGIVFALILGLGTIVAGAFIALKIPSAAGAISGTIMGISGIASIVATFLKGTKVSWKNKD